MEGLLLLEPLVHRAPVERDQPLDQRLPGELPRRVLRRAAAGLEREEAALALDLVALGAPARAEEVHPDVLPREVEDRQVGVLVHDSRAAAVRDRLTGEARADPLRRLLHVEQALGVDLAVEAAAGPLPQRAAAEGQ
jgi:hypothetical protein